MVQVPLNTEGLENNKSHFKRRHLAEFLLLTTWNLAGLEEETIIQVSRGPALLHTGPDQNPFQNLTTNPQYHGSGVWGGPSGPRGPSGLSKRPLCT